MSVLMGAGDRFAEKEAAFTCIMIADLFLAAGEKGDEPALGDHLQVDDEVEVMRMQVFADFFPIGELLDALPVDEIDFIDPRLAGQNACEGGVYGPCDPRFGIGFTQGVERGERVDDVPQGAHFYDQDVFVLLWHDGYPWIRLRCAVSWALWRIGMIKYISILSHFSSCFDENLLKKECPLLRASCFQEIAQFTMDDI